MTWEIRNGHCLDLLRAMPEASVQCVVTSPPYWGLRDYGIPPSVWGGDPAHVHEWAETTRVGEMRRGLGLADSPANTRGGSKKVATIPDVVATTGTCSCGAWRGCLGLEPTPELYVEHVVDAFREVRRVLRNDGTLWLNVGDSYTAAPHGHGDTCDPKWPGGRDRSAESSRSGPRVGHRSSFRRDRMERQDKPHKSAPALKPKDLVGVPWMVAVALRTDGWWLRSDIIWHKPNPMPESVTDRPTKAHEYVFLLAKSERYYYDGEAIFEPHVMRPQARPNGHKRRRPGILMAEHTYSGTVRDEPGVDGNPLGRNRRSVWTVATQPFAGAHFATFPEALVEPCVLAGSRPGDQVLDPFAGSGTVGVVALRHGRHFVGLELNPGYATMARRRIAGPLFAEAGA